MRIALGLEYDGSHYHGWQSQAGLHTIQQAVELALSKVADSPISVICAGRTDTSVHATGQVIHFDSDKIRPIRAWIHGANNYLPKDIVVKGGREVDEHFHARYSALSRSYRYLIYNGSVRPALFRSNFTWQYRQLNHESMHKAASYLLGEQDFTSFRSIECQSNSPFRNIHSLDVSRIGDMVIIDITANAFLHHMVRNIAGVLMTIGSNKRPVHWIKDVLEAKDRQMGAETASPYGLYLVHVDYPKDFGLTKSSLGLNFLWGK